RQFVEIVENVEMKSLDLFMSHSQFSPVDISTIEDVSRKIFYLHNRTYVPLLIAINLSSLWSPNEDFLNRLKEDEEMRDVEGKGESRNCSKCSERKLCPECPSINDLEKEGYYISPTVLVNETPKKKRKIQEGDTHKSRPKRATKPKAIIQELSVASTSSGPSISTPSETTNIGEISNQFHKLYYDVDIAEKKGDQENRDVIQCYFRFGRALPERLAVLLKNNPPQTAHT
ncbi:12161_t:CDS:2, partial [Ambispora leptoticha]